MANSLKFLFLLITGLIGFVVAALLAALLILDPNDYKGEIATLVEKRTGRRLTIKEDFSLSVFPWLGVRLGALELGNAPGFGEDPFARLDSMQVKVKLKPLLQQRLEVDTVAIDGLDLNLMRNAAGRGNWEDLQSGTGKPEAAVVPPAGQPESAAAAPAVAKPLLAAWAVNGLALKNARINWRDEAAKAYHEVHDLNIQIGALTKGGPIPLKVSFTGKSAASPVSGQVELDGRVTLDLTRQRYGLEVAGLSIDGKGQTLPNGGIRLDSRFNADVDLEKQFLKVTGLTLSLPGLKVTGEITGQQLLATPQFNGSLSLPAINLRTTLRDIGLPAPKTADQGVLNRVALDLKFNADPQHLQIRDLRATLDESQLQGGVTIEDFKNPRLAWNLNLDRIDLDRYLPPKSQGAPTAGKGGPSGKPAPTAKTGGEEPPPLAALAVLNMDGGLRVGRLQAANLKINDIDLKIKAENGVLRLTPLTAKLYRGVLSGNVILDARRRTPRVRVEQFKLNGLNTAALLKDLNGPENIAAETSISADLALAGLDAEDILKTLAGTIRVALKGVRVDNLKIAQLQLTATPKAGVITIDPISARLYKGSVNGGATVDIRDKTPRIKLKNVKVRNLQAAPLLRDLNGQKNISAETNLTANLALAGTDADSILKTLAGTVKVALRRIRVDNLRVSRLDLTARQKRGVTTIHPLSARLYRGALTGSATIDARRQPPLIKLKNIKANQIQAGPLLKDLTGKDPITGQANLRADLRLLGGDAATIKKTLDGKTHLVFKNGALKGVNIPQMIRNAYNTFKGLPTERSGTYQKTDFSELSASTAIRRGVIDNRDLKMVSPLLRIRGEGQVDLPRDRINYLVKTGVVGTLTGQGGKPMEELTGLTIPIRLTGPTAKPSWQLDINALLKEAFAKKAQEKLKSKATKEVDRFIKKQGLEKVLPGIDGGKLLEGLGF